jgi:hypothetical protein
LTPASAADDSQAHQLVARFVGLYNEGDAAGLYGLFDARAQAQFTALQLKHRLPRLRSRLGHIEDFRYVSSSAPMTYDGQPYLSLAYALKLSGGLAASATLYLTITADQTQLDAWAFRLAGESDESTPGSTQPAR